MYAISCILCSVTLVSACKCAYILPIVQCIFSKPVTKRKNAALHGAAFYFSALKIDITIEDGAEIFYFVLLLSSLEPVEGGLVQLVERIGYIVVAFMGMA